MDSHNRSSVLVCVTGQHDCDRLIKVGEKIASSKDMQLHVLCVHPPVEDLSLMSSEIEYLYNSCIPRNCATYSDSYGIQRKHNL